ncbi:MAG: EutN/CcmL family microcompartment protein, partial [Candidatus Hodarchaeales archaeon]|jgi:ethanolamine utilization protein EutN
VRPIDLTGNYIGDSMIALDTAQAGIGDCVLVIQEGNSIRSIMKDDNGAVDALIVGIVDFITTDGKQRKLTMNSESDN